MEDREGGKEEAEGREGGRSGQWGDDRREREEKGKKTFINKKLVMISKLLF